MNTLPRVEFEENGTLTQGDLLGFVPVGYALPSLPPGQVCMQRVEGGTFDDKHGFVGGYIEDPTNIFAMVGCNDGSIRRIRFHLCRYIKEANVPVSS